MVLRAHAKKEIAMFNKKKYSLTEGPMFFRITAFALPIMLTGILQILYGMADNIVVGQFSGDLDALGAVGSTSSLNNLTLHMLLGLSAGSAVVVAQSFGAKQDRVVSRAVHTAMILSVIGGLLFMGIGLTISRPVLTLMGTKPELFDKAVLYYRIICIGLPASSVYNFGGAILRSIGDSKTPLVILSSSGIVNVALNLVFVIGCGMAVEGVGIATIISQYISAVWVVAVLFKRKAQSYALSLKKFCFDLALFKRILRFGVPAGLQSSMFGISNVLLTSAINTFPSAAVKANTIGINIDALTYTVCNAFSTTAMTFSGQNFGAKKFDRVKRVFIYTILQATIFGISVGLIELAFLEPFSSMYIDSTDPMKAEIIAHVKEMSGLLLCTYFLCGIMEALSSSLKGLGYSLAPMLISVFCICGVRIFWVFVIFPLPAFNTLRGLYLSYPISWSMTILMLSVLTIFARKKMKKIENSTL